MNVVFVHEPGAKFLTPDFPSQYFYNFFCLALPRNKRIQYRAVASNYPTKAQLEDADVVLLFSTCEKLGKIHLPDGIRGRVVANAYDSSYIDADYIKTAERCGCEHFFYHHCPEWFYSFAPKLWKYKQVQMILEPSLYRSVVPWEQRQKHRVLLTGQAGNNGHYMLRKKLTTSKATRWVHKTGHFDGKAYPLLLQNFRAHVAACSVTTVNKYAESMAAGCLTFAEANDKNGWRNLGLENKENCVLINRHDCEHRMAEYLESCDEPHWKRIAEAGREHAMTKLNNDVQVDKLVDWFEEICSR